MKMKGMELYLYKLKFKGPVHFGDTGIDLENVVENAGSDTVFSALVNAINIYYGSKEAGELIERFLEDPPFLISSLFLYHNDLYFLPRPMDDSFIPENVKAQMGKDLKKLKWLEKDDFMRWLGRETFTVDDIKEMKEKQDEYKNAFVKEIRPRVTLDRVTQQSTIYHCGYLYFKKDAGLYGLVAFKDKTFIERFKDLINLLGQTGIGGERTYGCGKFEVIFQSAGNVFKSIFQINSGIYTLLSLYHPAPEEQTNFTDNLIAYDFTRKKGWITSGRYALPLKRKSVGFITEGSVLKRAVRGCLVDVTPDNSPPGFLNHRVYRYGYAFTAPLSGV